MTARSLGGACAALVAATASAVLAAPAAADSLVFIRDHDVWVAAPDGSAARALTADGTERWPYRSPSQADDGTIVAGHENDVVRLGRDGTVLNRFTTPPTTDAASQPIGGGGSASPPLWSDLSPDGALVAFGYADPTTRLTVVLVADAASAQTPTRFTRLVSVRNPSWVSASRLMTFGGAFQEVNLTDLPSTEPVHWFDPEHGGAEDGELSPDGTRLAWVDGTKVVVATVAGDARAGALPPAATATPLCDIAPVEAVDADPTWSPDGHRLAYSTPDGIEVTTLPTDDCAQGTSQVVLRGASQPDWGPADPGAARQQEQPGPAAAASLGPLRVRGRRATASLTCAADCRWRAVLKDGRETVGRRAGRAAAGTSVTVTVKARRRLGRGARLIITAGGSRVVARRGTSVGSGGGAT